MKDKNTYPKFKTEAHRRNFDLVMKAREEQRKRPLNIKDVIGRMKRNSKDNPDQG